MDYAQQIPDLLLNSARIFTLTVDGLQSRKKSQDDSFVMLNENIFLCLLKTDVLRFDTSRRQKHNTHTDKCV